MKVYDPKTIQLWAEKLRLLSLKASGPVDVGAIDSEQIDEEFNVHVRD